MYDELFKKLRPLLTNNKQFNDIGKILAIRYELAEAKANALQALFEARPELLRPKDKDVTDLDRKTQMEGWTAEKERDYTFLCDLWTIIDDLIKMKGTDLKAGR
jgi:hypothetical protein